MAQLVYGCRFDVPGEGAWDTLVRPQYEHWIKDRYSKSFKTSLNVDLRTGKISGSMPEGHAIAVRWHEADDVATELEWSFPGEQRLIWRNLVRVAQIGGFCIVEHRVEVGSADYLISPAVYSVGAPVVVRTICQREVFVGEMRVRATVYPLLEDGVDQFIGLLEAEQRRLPIVLLTPHSNGDRGELDARALADHLAGIAIVTEAGTPETTRALSRHLGKLGCYDGGVRVYWPGLRKNDDLRRHPLMLGSRVAILGREHAARVVERSIFSVAAFRFVPDSRIGAIIARTEAAARAQRAQEAVGQGNATWEEYALEMSKRLDAALAEIEELRAENQNLHANQSVFFAFSGEEDDQTSDEAPAERNPKSVAEAVTFAADDCPCLIFLDSSRSSAEASPFKRPGEIYEVLTTMNKVAEAWAMNPGAGDLRQMLKVAGLGKRVSSFISPTTKGKWGDEYTFIYDGKRQLFEWHVTLGAGAADTCASIHFLPDQARGKLVVGYVGRHLTNTRS
jgi:hypothetical protein